MTSFASVAEAVNALKEGAHDYLTKPFDVDELVLRVGMIARARGPRARSWRRRARASPGASRRGDRRRFPGDGGVSSIASRPWRRATRRCSSSARPARARSSSRGRLHARSQRASGPFVAVNCAAFPETLLEAELFGYERGRVHGRGEEARGALQGGAIGGTLFLDEVAEMPLPAQAKLLRVVQEGVIEPLGTNDRRAGRRAPRVRDEPRPQEGHRRGALPGGSLLPAQRRRPAASRRCASAPGDLPVLVRPLSLPVLARPARSSPRSRCRPGRRSRAYPFPATCASLRTPSSTRPSSRAGAPSSSSTCPTTS